MLHAGDGPGTVEWTISGYLIGFSLGQLLWGPIGDRHGRRLPVAIGLVLFVISSAGCALAGSIWAMIGWRVVQAVGACAGVVLAELVELSPFHFSRVFKQATGMSPLQLVTRERVTRTAAHPRNLAQPHRDRARSRLHEPEPFRTGLFGASLA